MKNGVMGMWRLVALFVIALICTPVAHAVDGEITYTGTNTTLTGDDVGAGPFNLGFTFDFYGTDYTQTYVNINGTLNFAANYSRYSNVPLSTSLSGTNIADNSIYAFWDDLNTNGSQIIYYATVGTAPERKFVTQWTNIYFHGTSIQLGTFQVILYEGSDVVQIQYRDLLGGNRALGDSATIGIRKNNSTSIQYSHNTASLTAEQAIRYTPNGSGGYTVNTSAPYELVYLAPAGAPTSPTLVNPSNNTTGVTLRPTFEWLPVDSATSYTVLVSTASNFSSTVVNQSGVTGTSYTLGSDLSASTNYYWRVQAVNGSGSSLSPTRTFQTGSANAAPSTPSSVTSDQLTGAAESYDLDDAEMTLTLADPDDAEQVRYRIQIATDSDFNELVIDYRSPFAAEGSATYTYGESGGTYLVGNSSTVLPVDSYYLRIRAEDDAAASSAWYTVSGIAFSIAEEPADITAPGISSISADPEEETATLYWNTDEAASSQVQYGPSSSYVASTTESNTVTRVLEHEVELTGLRSCVTYNFRVVSKDSAGNSVQSDNGTFTTKGCTGQALVTSQTSEAIATSTGGTLSLTSSGKGLSLSVPSNFSSSSIHFQIKKIDEGAVIASTSIPTGQSSVGTYTYALHAVTDTLEIVEEFDEPLTLTLSYGDEDVEGLVEATLAIYRWNGDSWQALSNCSVDEAENEVTCDTDHFSTFGLFGTAFEEDEVSDSTRDAGSKKGTSIKQQVANLVRIGNVAKADEIKEDWPALFPEGTSTSVASSTPLLVVRDLETFSEGDDVRALQDILRAGAGTAAMELSRVGSTGYFGRYTHEALREYQATHGITPTSGYFGPLTRAQMKAAKVTGVWW